MGGVFQIGTHSPEAVISSATSAINLRIPESVFLGEGLAKIKIETASAQWCGFLVGHYNAADSYCT